MRPALAPAGQISRISWSKITLRSYGLGGTGLFAWLVAGFDIGLTPVGIVVPI